MTDTAESSLYRLPTNSRSARQSVSLAVLGLLVVDALTALSLASQILAHRLGDPPRFGPALFVHPPYPSPLLGAAAVLFATFLAGLCLHGRYRSALPLVPLLAILSAAACGPLYPPLSWLRWQRLLAPYPAARPHLEAAAAVFYVALAVSLATTVAYLGLRLRQLRTSGDTHGSSRWASPADIKATGLLDDKPGLVVGAVDLGRRSRYLRDSTDRHLLLFAPSGTGKSTCLVIPTLLEWPHSTVVLDIKGELWQHTAGYRQKVLGNRCLRFDPSADDGTAARYNPLFAIAPNLASDKHAQALADVLIDPDGSMKARDFWQESAHALLVGTILHVLFAEPNKTFSGCLHFLTDPARPFGETLVAMRGTHHDPDLRLGWTDPATGRPTPVHPTVASVAANLINVDWRTTSNILATAVSRLNLYCDSICARNTESSDFTAEDLVDPAAAPVSLYLTIPPSELLRLRGLSRIVLNQLAMRLTDRLDHHPQARRRPLLLLLDEFTALGSIEFLHRAIAYLRGYGILVFISIQSLSQLFQVYGTHQSITTNCGVQVSYGANDAETAKLLSDMTGRTTINFERPSVSGGAFGLGGRHTYSQTETARPLLTPDEVRRLPADESLIFVAGAPPIRGRRVPYYKDPVFRERAAIPPPAVSDRIPHDWSVWTDWQAIPPSPSALDGPGRFTPPGLGTDLLRDGPL